MNVLVLNSGSSSLKFKLFSLPELRVAAKGIIEEIGTSSGALTFFGPDEVPLLQERRNISSHLEAVAAVTGFLSSNGNMDEGPSDLLGIGHRVVHGGELFTGPVLITDRVVQELERLVPLAPLHNPANLTGIRVAMELAPHTPQVAVFDTAFHQSIDPRAYLYAIPRHLYEDHGIRRYGFHGTSFSYVTAEAAKFLGQDLADFSCVCLHLGNGCSAVAVINGKSVDTSMGLTPLEGLVMGTRCGDMDPSIIGFLVSNLSMTPDEIDGMLNHRSGLLGLCGESDMRVIERRALEGDQAALSAIEVFCHRAKKYVGAYMAIVGRPHCLVFTGGIGENSPLIRRKICHNLDWLGISLDDGKNEAVVRPRAPALISSEEGRLDVLVVPTNEELEIARQTISVLRDHGIMEQ